MQIYFKNFLNWFRSMCAIPLVGNYITGNLSLRREVVCACPVVFINNENTEQSLWEARTLYP